MHARDKTPAQAATHAARIGVSGGRAAWRVDKGCRGDGPSFAGLGGATVAARARAAPVAPARCAPVRTVRSCALCRRPCPGTAIGNGRRCTSVGGGGGRVAAGACCTTGTCICCRCCAMARCAACICCTACSCRTSAASCGESAITFILVFLIYLN